MPVRPAATVMVVRDSAGGAAPEVLMLKRHAASVFAAGAWVFPGGGVDPDDESIPVFGQGPTDAHASALVGVPAGGVAFWVAALRECFEESGLLLAVDALSGTPLDASDGALAGRLAASRLDLCAGRRSLADILRSEGLALALDDVHFVARWITPPGRPRRFDTRFFVAAAPAGQLASHDTAETVASVWTTPAGALGRFARGEIDCLRPTLVQLRSLAPFATVAGVLAWAGSLAPPVTVAPVVPALPADSREAAWPT
ncbi:MAG: NUDIX hydrolase [Acidimicrobiia bacterium]